MSNQNKNTGLTTTATILMVLGAAIILVVGGGYFFLKTTNPTPLTDQSAVNSNNTDQNQNTVQNNNSNPIAQTSKTQTNTSSTPISSSNSQSLDCSKYLSANEVISDLGLSSQTKVTITPSGNTTSISMCLIHWSDSAGDSGGIQIANYGLANSGLIISGMCKNTPSFDVGDKSCYNGPNPKPIGTPTVIFTKNGFLVQIILFPGVQTITTGEITSIANLIASRI